MPPRCRIRGPYKTIGVLPVFEDPVRVSVSFEILRKEYHRFLLGLLRFEKLRGLLRSHLHDPGVIRILGVLLWLFAALILRRLLLVLL